MSLVPGARRVLGTTPLNMMDLLVIAAGVVLPLIVNEGTKRAAPEETEAEEGESPAGAIVGGPEKST